MLHLKTIAVSSYLVILVTLSPSHELTKKHTITQAQIFLNICKIIALC